SAWTPLHPTPGVKWHGRRRRRLLQWGAGTSARSQEGRVRVVELSACQVRIPFRRAIRHATTTRAETDNVLVRCVLEDGTVGHGEGVPRDYVTGETLDSSLALLSRTDLRAQLEPCRDFAHAVEVAERLLLAEVPGDARHCQGNAARCA